MPRRTRTLPASAYLIYMRLHGWRRSVPLNFLYPIYETDTSIDTAQRLCNQSGASKKSKESSARPGLYFSRVVVKAALQPSAASPHPSIQPSLQNGPLKPHLTPRHSTTAHAHIHSLISLPLHPCRNHQPPQSHELHPFIRPLGSRQPL